MNIMTIPINQINAAAYNPRVDLQPGDPEYEKLRRSIQEFGYVEPIVWNERTGNMVGGNQRYKIIVMILATRSRRFQSSIWTRSGCLILP